MNHAHQIVRGTPILASILLLACEGDPSSGDSFRGSGHADDGHWTKLKTKGSAPSGRSAPAVATIDRSVYLFGGSFDDVVSGDVELYDDFYRFDTASSRWHELDPQGPRPAARAFAAATTDVASDRMLVYGGATFGPFFSDFVAFEDLWTYEADSGAWTELQPQNEGPQGRSGAAIWLWQGDLYLFGGITTFFEVRNDLWSFDLDTHAWTELIPQGAQGSPPPRHEAQHGGRVQGGRMLIYGGEALDENFAFLTLADTWAYQMSTGTWTELTPSPADDIDPPRYLGASALLHNRLYLHGGDMPGGEVCGAVFAQNPTDELWEFNPARRRWEPLLPSGDPLPRLKRSRGVAANGAMLVFSGYDFACNAGTPEQLWSSDVYRYRP